MTLKHMLQRNNYLKKNIAPFFTHGEVKQLFLYMLEAKTIRKPRKVNGIVLDMSCWSKFPLRSGHYNGGSIHLADVSRFWHVETPSISHSKTLII